MLSVNEKNSYGERTFKIKVIKNYEIKIIEKNGGKKILKLLDKGLIFTSVEFEVSIEKDIEEALSFSFYKSKSHINSKRGNEWKRGDFKRQLSNALQEIKKYSNKGIDIESKKSSKNKVRLNKYYKNISKKIGKKETIKFFQENNIDKSKFYSNYNEISGSFLQSYVKSELNSSPTRSINENLHKLLPPPPAYPTWFAAAFPDVVLWVQDKVESGNEDIEDRINRNIPYAEKNGRFPNSFFEYVIHKYKENNDLECKRDE